MKGKIERYHRSCKEKITLMVREYPDDLDLPPNYVPHVKLELKYLFLLEEGLGLSGQRRPSTL